MKKSLLTAFTAGLMAVLTVFPSFALEYQYETYIGILLGKPLLLSHYLPLFSGKIGIAYVPLLSRVDGRSQDQSGNP